MGTAKSEPQPAGQGGSVQVRGGGQAACVHAQHYRLGATRECVGMRCSTSAPTMAFRSLGPHQRTILSSDSSPVSPLGGVVVFSNADKGGLIDTLKRVWKVRSAASQPAGRTKELLQYVQLERTNGQTDVDNPTFDAHVTDILP
ncbi:hypothetical protein EDB89DRAFT_228593 [Lactarius sanguifluus]|nr:hypothetical protein EDB89DRAFT_228593 [Lactarius sanguifluus]